MTQHSSFETQSRKRFMSIKEAADYLGLSPNTLYSWNSQGIYLPVMKFGRRVMVDMNDLDAFVDANKKHPRLSDGPEGSRGRLQ
jgi:excisionase family DNA binding protein